MHLGLMVSGTTGPRMGGGIGTQQPILARETKEICVSKKETINNDDNYDNMEMKE